MSESEVLREKAEAIHAVLLEEYGEPDWRPKYEPVDELILTILSANTNDRNSLKAFKALKKNFHGDWDAIRQAPLDDIKTAIRPAGMYNQKAPRIVETLQKLKVEQGAYNLDHLSEMPVDEALAYLQEFPGVGHKTASIVLLFCFNAGAFPVDTHVQRQSQRLGISELRSSPARIKAIWETLLPPQTYYALHLNLIRHGREICQARNPKCNECVLQQLCDYYNQRGEWQTENSNIG